MILLDEDLKARVYARDAGCCQVCLITEPPHMGLDFTVKRYDMTDPAPTEGMGDVALFCERCVAVIKRYLALTQHEVFIQNDEDVVERYLRVIEKSE